MSKPNKLVFKVKIDDKDVELAVERPSREKNTIAGMTYNKAFRAALESKAILRAKIEQIMREQKLWDDEKEKKYEDLRKNLIECEKKLAKGGIKKSEARTIALKMRDYRGELALLLTERNALDANSAEAQAEDAKFNHLVALCTVYNDSGNLVFKDLEDYHSQTDNEVALEAARHLMRLIYNRDPDWQKKLPENKFLLKYGFVNDDLHLIRKDGKTIDSEGRLVDSQGRFITEDGKLVDIDGTPVDSDGNFDFGSEPIFEDDDEPLPAKRETQEEVLV